MDLGRILKWVVVAAVLFVAWKVIMPWVAKEVGGAKSRVAGGVRGGDNTCVQSAEEASEAWGRGLSQFVNPPYDMSAWATFRGDVDSKISAAESRCGCVEASCDKTREAMRELRTLVSDLDVAIRTSGSPPGDVVHRQESIDSRISEAAELVRAGK